MCERKVRELIIDGLHHLRVATEICKRRRQKGKFFLLERPATSHAWDESFVKELMQMEGVYVCKVDVCMYGLKVAEGYNKKPTLFIANSYEVAMELRRRCDGSHEHQNLMSGRAKKAEEYPSGLCRAVVRGLKKQLGLGKTEEELFHQGDEIQELYMPDGVEVFAEDDIEELAA